MINWDEKVKLYSERPKSDRRKDLFYGLSKTGKTTIAGTYPNPLFIDTDGSMGGLSKEKQKLIKSVEIKQGDKNIYRTLKSLFEELKSGEYFKDIQTIVFDSVTALADFLLVEAMKSPVVGKKMRDPTNSKPSYDEYGVLEQQLASLFTMIDELPHNIVVTAGSKWDKDDQTGATIGSIAIVGSFRHKIEYRLDGVFYLLKEKGKYFAYTEAVNRFNAGVRNWKGDVKVESLTYDKIIESTK